MADKISRDQEPVAVQAMFNEIAPSYDLLNFILSFGRDSAWRKLTVRKLDPPSKSKILDLCAGTMDFQRSYEKQFAERELTVISADFSFSMLNTGLKKFKEKNWAEPLPVTADALNLPFSDETFDFISISFGFRNIKNREAALQEMRRVLKTGGKLAILEFSPPQNKFLRGISSAYLFTALPLIGHIVSRSSSKAYSYLPETIWKFPMPGDLLELLKKEEFSPFFQTKMNFQTVVLTIVSKS
jgi:demethylmenaquinone methyltransferase/2-methoxy-6-polyprenyl-1,4-benzoquinol methylase